MYVQYCDGMVRRACVLTFCGDTLRLALEGSDDAVELKFVNGIWINEENAPVVLRFPAVVAAAHAAAS